MLSSRRAVVVFFKPTTKSKTQSPILTEVDTIYITLDQVLLLFVTWAFPPWGQPGSPPAAWTRRRGGRGTWTWRLSSSQNIMRSWPWPCEVEGVQAGGGHDVEAEHHHVHVAQVAPHQVLGVACLLYQEPHPFVIKLQCLGILSRVGICSFVIVLDESIQFTNLSA